LRYRRTRPYILSINQSNNIFNPNGNKREIEIRFIELVEQIQRNGLIKKNNNNNNINNNKVYLAVIPVYVGFKKIPVVNF